MNSVTAPPPPPLAPPRLPPLEGGYITGTLAGGVTNVALYTALLLLALAVAHHSRPQCCWRWHLSRTRRRRHRARMPRKGPRPLPDGFGD